MKKVQVLGNLTADAEIRTLESGKQVLNFTVAVNTSYKDKNGDKVTKTDYFDCFQFFNADKEIRIAQYLRKGGKLLVEGEPEAQAYINNEGKAVGKVKIKINEIHFAGSAQAVDPLANEPAANHSDFTPSNRDDLPF